MTRKHFYIAVLIVLLALFGSAAAQDQGSDQKKDQAQSAPAEPTEGVNSDGYNIRQTIEVGGRIFSGHGSQQTYDTFVNLHSGPRLLEQSLDMRSLPGATGQVFDHLSLSTFGFGGDPNDVARVRIGKRRYYDFSGMFRRDKNYWDYNLFVNPYNPPFPPPGITAPATAANWPANPLINQSAHGFDLVRRMTDLGLTIAPDSIVSGRIGFGHNIMEGTSYTTMHEGGDVMLLQPWRMRTNTLRFGVDFKMIPRTRLSFDQTFDWFRQDTSALNMASPVGDFVTTFAGTANTPINGGVVFMPNTPCASPVINPPGNTASPMQWNPICTGYVDYTRTMPLRGRFPTSVVTLKSNYFRALDFYARGGYSDGEQNVSNYNEAWAGLLSRTREQTFTFTGPMHIRRVSAFADLGATVHITDNIRINDTFYWNNWRTPSIWDSNETATFANGTPASMATAPNIYSPATCNPGSLAGCPVHSSSSGPDVGVLAYTNFHRFDTKMNLIELDFGLTKQIGFHAGWRWRKRAWTQSFGTSGTETYYPGPTLASARRGDCATTVTDPDITQTVDPVTGVCTAALDLFESEAMPQVTDNSLVAGVWVRPVHALLLEFDTEISHANQVFTRLSPRNSKEFRMRAHYRPQTWYSFGAVADLISAKNDWVVGDTAPDVHHNEHNRTFGFNFSVFPKEWFALDVGYDYNDFATHTNSCYVWAITGVTTPPTSTASLNNVACATSANAWLDDSYFTNNVNTGFFNLVLKPVKRVTTTFGYTITSNRASSTGVTPEIPIFGPYSTNTDTGTTYGLNPYAPVGALSMNYHLPSIMLAVEMTKRLTFKAGWNYYDYNEKYPAGYTAPRDFAANLTSLSLRYSF